MSKKAKIIIISVILAIVIIALAIVGVTLLSQNKTPSIYIEANDAKIGEYVTAQVGIKDNIGFMASYFMVDYDDDELEYIGYEGGKITEDVQVEKMDGMLKVVTVQSKDVKKDGSMVELKFKAIGSDEGKTEIDVEITKKGFCNYNEEFVEVLGAEKNIIIK